MPRFDFDDVEFDRNILELELMTGRAFLSRAEAKAGAVGAWGLAVRAWIDSFRRVAADAEGVLDGFERRRRESEDDHQAQTPAARARRALRYLTLQNPALVRLAAARDVRRALTRVQAVVRVVYKSGLLDAAQAPEALFRQTTSLMYDPPGWVVGRDGDVEATVELLLGQRDQRDAQVLAVTGAAGVGKTALARMVFNDARVQEHFDLAMWDWVGDCGEEDGGGGRFGTNAVLRSVVEAAADARCDVPDDLNLLVHRLKKAIGGRRFLLVLDDVWNEDESRWVDNLRPLLCCCGFGAPGSVVVVTSRSTRVGEIMGTLPPHELAGLGEEDSWKLFSKHAFGSGVEERKELVAIGRDIVQNCEGLPLALRTFGALVSTRKHAREWCHVRDFPSSFVSSSKYLAIKRNA